MIDQFETEQTNYYSLAGRSALIGGGVYAGYSAFREMRTNRPTNPNNTNQRADAGRLRNIRPTTPKAHDITTGPAFSEILGNTRELRKAQKLSFQKGMPSKTLSGMGHKSKGQLNSHIQQLQKTLSANGFTGIEVFHKQVGDHVGELRIQGRYGNRRHTFRVNPVAADATVLFGDNLQGRYIARSILDQSSISNGISAGNIKAVDSDVALVNRYIQDIEGIKKGTINPTDLYKKVQNTILFEDGGSGGVIDNAVALLRREQVVVDAFGDMSSAGRSSVMRSISQLPGWMAGSAAQFSKGILNSPDSILNKMIPGSGVSPSAYQYLRQSEFDASVKPSVDWFGEAKVGVGEFTYAYAKDKKQLEGALQHMGYKIGEVAPEEMLMNKSRDFKVKNQIYNAKVDLDMLSTPSSMGLLEKVRSKLDLPSTQELGRVLAAPGGISSLGPDAISKLDFDINEDYKKLLEQKNMLIERRKVLKHLPLNPEEYTQARQVLLDDVRKTRHAIKEYEAFGVSADMANAAKLPSIGLQNRITSMSINANNQLSIGMQTHYRFGVGSKSFGAAKSTVKAEVDTAAVMAQLDFFADKGRYGSPEEIESIKSVYKDVDFIGIESPVKVSGSAMEARRMPSAVSTYISTAIAEGRADELAALGVEKTASGYNLADKDPRSLITKIQELNPDKDMGEIFSGTVRGSADVSISRAILSADVHSIQSGAGGAGTITQRGTNYLSALGLNEVVNDIDSRSIRMSDTISQIQTLEAAKTAKPQVGIKTLMGENLLSGESSTILQPNLDNRARVIENLGGKGSLTVGLGREIEGIDKVTIFSQQSMAPYIGQQIGTEDSITALDRATQDLLEGIAGGKLSDDAIAARAIRYKEEIANVQESLVGALSKAKVKGSMYGQAVSSVAGLNMAGQKLGQQMGLGEDVIAPIVAMSKEDIRHRFGGDALKRAEAGDLFGIVTREPLEGVHSVIPSKIVVAESSMGGAAGELGDMRGRVFFAQSDMMRNSLMIDFDKDMTSVIAAQSEEANQQLKAFMGLAGEQPRTGVEYYKSLQRMPYLDPKGGKSPVDALSTLDSELSGIISAQKQLEKSHIGTFSNEFKNIHTGLRAQLQQGGDPSRYFTGEDFSHTFIENILKSKHQSKEALLKNEALETLDVLRAKGKYASASIDERALRMQEIFDQLSFASVDEAKEARNIAAEFMSNPINKEAHAMGIADIAADFTSDKQKTLKSLAYAEVSSLDNIKNILQARETGIQIASHGDPLYNAAAGQKTMSALGQKIDDAVFLAKSFSQSAVGKIGKYAIAPAAIIGLASSVFSAPNVLRKSAASHEVSDASPESTPTVDAGKTIFAIPESKVDNILIKGRADARTDFTSMQSFAASKGGYNASIQDMRSKPDKHRLQELIDKGY